MPLITHLSPKMVMCVVDSFCYVGFLWYCLVILFSIFCVLLIHFLMWVFFYDTAWGCTFFNFLCVVDSFSYVGSLWYCVVKLFSIFCVFLVHFLMWVFFGLADLLHILSFLPKSLNFVNHSSYIGWKEYGF